MSGVAAAHPLRPRIDARVVPVLGAVAVFIVTAGFGSVAYGGFFSPQVFLNLLIDNAFLCIVGVGMTFVILSGGIDLSVGAVIALTTMVSAALVEQHHWSAAAAIPLVLAMGTAFGAFMGWLITRFRLQPFIVTLAGMFLARGLCYLISIDSISITDAGYTAIAQTRIPLWATAHRSRSARCSRCDGRARHLAAPLHRIRPHRLRDRRQRAVGVLMGLPVARTTVLVYTVQRLLLGAGRRGVHVLHAVGLRAARGRAGARCDRRGRDRRHLAQRRRRLCDRHAVRRADPGHRSRR
jgi:simple sugar transport system permease protein